MVLCSSLLFAYRGFGHTKKGIAMCRCGTAHPTNPQDILCCAREQEAAKLLRDVGSHPPGGHPAHRATSMGRAQPLHLCNAKHRTGFQSEAWEAVCSSHWWQTSLQNDKNRIQNTEIVFKYGWPWVEKITDLLLSLLGNHSDPVGYYTRGKRWRLLISLVCLEGR